MKVILQGTIEENKKAVSVLEGGFGNVKKLASVAGSEDLTTVVEIFAPKTVKGFTAEETAKAIELCCRKERECFNCPYSKIKNCKDEVQADFALIVVNMLQNATTCGGADND